MMNEKEKVGTELSKLIPDWAVQFKGRCGCNDMQKKMDRWGLAGCEANRKAIVNHLTQQSDKLIPAFRIASGLVPEAAKRVLATKLLNKAMRNAKKEAEQ